MDQIFKTNKKTPKIEIFQSTPKIKTIIKPQIGKFQRPTTTRGEKFPKAPNTCAYCSKKSPDMLQTHTEPPTKQ